MKRILGVLSLLVLLALALIFVTRGPIRLPAGTEIGPTPVSSLFESPLPTPSPTALALASTATMAPVPSASPTPPPTELPVSPLPSPTVTPAPGEWREFVDLEAGYSINFPADAVISAGKSKGEAYQAVLVAFRLEEMDKFQYEGMSLWVQPNKEKPTVKQVIENLYGGMSGGRLPEDMELTSQIEEIVVAGLPAFQTDILPDSTSVYVFIPYHERVYIFALVHALTSNASDPRAEKLFYEILDSFKVLETP